MDSLQQHLDLHDDYSLDPVHCPAISYRKAISAMKVQGIHFCRILSITGLVGVAQLGFKYVYIRVQYPHLRG